MGGAGFPTGQKWEIVAGQEAAAASTRSATPTSPSPGTFKDRQILAEQPHLVLEGMLLGMLVTGSEEGWVFIRHEYGPEEQVAATPRSSAARGRAPRRRRRSAPAGGSQIEIFTSPGGYILGEESALLECMEGHRGEPRNKPPFPGALRPVGQADADELGRDVRRRADHPRARRGLVEGAGRQRRDGPEVLRRLRPRRAAPTSTACAPGSTDARPHRAGRRRARTAARSARSSPAAPRRTSSAPTASTSRSTGSRCRRRARCSGSGALIVMAEGTNLLAAATNVLRFFRNESCGKCVPCRVGSTQGPHHPQRPRSSRARASTTCPSKITQLEETLRMTSICGLGPGRARAGAQRPGHGARRRRGARAPEGPRRHRDLDASADGRRPAEFFAVRTVAEALAGFRPARRTAVETRRAGRAHGRVPARAGPRAARPAGLRPLDGRRLRGARGRHLRRVRGRCRATSTSPARWRWAARREVAVAPGNAVAMPTGGVHARRAPTRS